MGKTAPPSLRIRFGRRVRAIRLRQELSLEALGEKSGLNDKFIQAVETARQSPTIDTIEKIASGLEIELGELFTFEEESPDVLRKRATRLVQSAEAQDLARIVRLLHSALY
jgi:transcriptional regulator with XRE-family HTH domain